MTDRVLNLQLGFKTVRIWHFCINMSFFQQLKWNKLSFILPFDGQWFVNREGSPYIESLHFSFWRKIGKANTLADHCHRPPVTINRESKTDVAITYFSNQIQRTHIYSFHNFLIKEGAWHLQKVCKTDSIFYAMYNCTVSLSLSFCH